MDESTSDRVRRQHTGLSRRDLIKRGAVAGGVVWAAPVIDSFTSGAFAAGSTPTGQANFGCSWAYLVWLDLSTQTIYYTGFQNDSLTACGSNAANPNHGTPSLSCNVNGANYTFVLGEGNPPEIAVTGAQTQTLTAPTSSLCGQLAYSGGGNTVISTSSTIELLGGFAFGANSINGFCPNSSGGGNSITVTCP